MMNSNKADISKLLTDVEVGLAKIQKGFDSYQNAYFEKRTPEFFCLELNGEAGELANIEKKRWKGRDIDEAMFADEAADVLIALMNYSNARGVDLAEAVSKKLQKIEGKRKKMADEGKAY
jgi:NTP pyrophosphatase (non-canonical NTP hydrolase)